MWCIAPICALLTASAEPLQVSYRSDSVAHDQDRDGLVYSEEMTHRIDPREPDSDQDGLLDGDALRVGANPLGPDTDGDGVLDGAGVPPGRGPSQAKPIAAPRLPLPTFAQPPMAEDIVTASPMKQPLQWYIPVLSALLIAWWGMLPKTRRALNGVMTPSGIHRP